jgi:hypothetical protein
MNRSFLGHAIGYATVACLCIAGTAQALPGENTVDSGDIIDGEVRRPDIAAASVTSGKVLDESLTYADIAPDSIYGKQIVETSLDFNSIGCRPRLTRSRARVKGSASMPSTFTTSSTYVDMRSSCADTQAISVRRLGVGNYEITFGNDTVGVALATPNGNDGDTDNTIAVTSMGSGLFRVVVRDQSGALDDGWFQIMTI